MIVNVELLLQLRFLTFDKIRNEKKLISYKLLVQSLFFFIVIHILVNLKTTIIFLQFLYRKQMKKVADNLESLFYKIVVLQMKK